MLGSLFVLYLVENGFSVVYNGYIVQDKVLLDLKMK